MMPKDASISDVCLISPLLSPLQVLEVRADQLSSSRATSLHSEPASPSSPTTAFTNCHQPSFACWCRAPIPASLPHAAKIAPRETLAVEAPESTTKCCWHNPGSKWNLPSQLTWTHPDHDPQPIPRAWTKRPPLLFRCKNMGFRFAMFPRI